MKTRILIAAAALATLAACTMTQVSGPSQEISFSAMTRANTDYKDGYSGVPFGAFAWFKGDDPADNANFMVNQQVAYESAGNRWVPSGTTYYWPKSGKLDFICYSLHCRWKRRPETRHHRDRDQLSGLERVGQPRRGRDVCR